MAAPEIEIRELDERDVPLAARFYDDVLRPSFSGDELDGWTSLEAGLRGGRPIALRMAVALDDSGAPVGGLTAELFPNSGVLLIGYVAVRSDWRGRGIGSRLLAWSARWYEDPAVVLVLGEVHDPDHDWNVPGEDARRRLRFFGRLGAQVLDVAFVQPALGPGQQRVPHFLLVVLAAKEAALVPPDRAAVDGHVIDRFVREYFDFCEGPVSERPDPELARLLASIPPAVRRRSLPGTSVG